MRDHFLPAVVLCLAVAAPARAQWAPDVNIGTLGAGVGATVALTGSSSLRLGIAGWSNITRDFSKSGVDYHAKIKLANAPILLDWYPGGGSFRLSAGIVPNNDKADIDAVPTNSSFAFNGTTYNASDVGSATGSVKVNSVAPYLGLGFGNPVGPEAGWSFGADLGVMYLGTPKATLTVTCSSSITPSECSSLQNDANAEADQLNEAIAKYRWYPVIQFRIAKKF